MAKLFLIPGFPAFLSVMFLNAFVDLGHKIIIQNTIFKIYDGETQVVLTAIVNGLILLPFIMLFTPAGFFADRFAKPSVMRASAAFAVLLTSLITVFYFSGWFEAAFVMTFLLAVQSAIYSPAKYGYIKELVGKAELGAANGLVQAVTITAILAGTFGFSIFFELRLAGRDYQTEADILRLIAPAGFILIGLSLLELFEAFQIADKPAADPGRPFNWPRYLSGRALRQNLGAIFSNQGIWLSIIGLATFWGLSQAVLAIFPAFAKEVTGETNTIYIQGAMAGAGIGIMLGSVIAGRASRHFIETGLIPVGAAGIVICLLILPFLRSVPAFAVNFIGLGLFGGLFIIPLNSLIQFYADEDELGTVLAGNNWIQNIVMTSFLGLTVLTSFGGLTMSHLLVLLTVVALLGSAYTLYRLPQSLARLALRLTLGTGARIAVEDFKNLPETGPVLAVLDCEDIRDWPFLQIVSPRPVHFLLPVEAELPPNRAWVARLLHATPLRDETANDIAERLTGPAGTAPMICVVQGVPPSETSSVYLTALNRLLADAPDVQRLGVQVSPDKETKRDGKRIVFAARQPARGQPPETV